MTAAEEPIPEATFTRRPLVIRGRPSDPLGYDTADIRAAARQMAEDALSGKTAAAVQAEREGMKARLGVAPSAGPTTIPPAPPSSGTPKG